MIKKQITRRTFLKTSAVAAGAVAASGIILKPRRAYAFAQSPGLTKFVDPLPGLGPSGIPVASPDGTLGLGGANHYSIAIGQFKQVLHSDFVTPNKPAFISGFKGTTLWGYASTAPADLVGGLPNFRHLGGVIVANGGPPAIASQITFTNKLVDQFNQPLRHPIPVDITIPGANQAQNRMAVHLHGGFVPWISDGGPFDWFDPYGVHGLSFLNNQVLNPGALPGQAEYYYPNSQSARLMWYHDHAFGTTRLSAYAGVATGYLITDGVETGLIGIGGALDGLGVGTPLVVQDKIFVANNISVIDPTWAKVVPDPSPGNLWYAHVYDPTRWKLANGQALPPPDPSAIPEFFGDTMLMNGHVYPFFEVPPKRVRFRLLNACNARFLNLQLFIQDASVDGITLNARTGLPTNPAGPPMVQIGTEGGFLPAPVVFNPPTTPFNPVTFNGTLLVAPAERADFIIDFNGLAPGTKVIMYNDAPAPFPVGDPRNDYFPGAPKNPTITTPGFGPNTRQIMQFRVGSGTGDGTSFATFVSSLNIAIPAAFNASQPPLLAPVTNPPAVPLTASRVLTLNEDFDGFGRLIQRLGTNLSIYKGTFGRNYTDAPTEFVTGGATEVWQICNLTGDTHPIHFHLVNVQIIARQAFNVKGFNGVPNLAGVPRSPDPNEMGWKETVRMNPGEVIWVIAKFDLPKVLPFAVPTSPRTGGNEYVWHCHILEHEEHDMMRPLVVI